MRIKPKSEHEIVRENLIPAGTYGFQIVEALEEISKAGNAMIKLNVQVFFNGDNYRFVTDYLMEKVAYKLRHAAEVCGLIEEYESGNLYDYEFVGKTGICKVVIQKDKTGQYPDKNNIVDYVKGGKSTLAEDLERDAVSLRDDDVPF